jgi:hypothetical protein
MLSGFLGVLPILIPPSIKYLLYSYCFVVTHWWHSRVERGLFATLMSQWEWDRLSWATEHGGVGLGPKLGSPSQGISLCICKYSRILKNPKSETFLVQAFQIKDTWPELGVHPHISANSRTKPRPPKHLWSICLFILTSSLYAFTSL